MPRISSLSTKAPAPIPFISQAVTCNGFVFCSGSLGLDPATSEFVESTTFDRAVGHGLFRKSKASKILVINTRALTETSYLEPRSRT